MEISGPGPGDAPSKQAELIRLAIGRRPAALIVDPPASPSVDKALDEAHAQGIPLVLLGRSVGSGSARVPIVVVGYPDFGASAAELVAAAQQAARETRLRTDGVAVLLVNNLADRYSLERAAALRQAISAAGITLRETIEFEGDPQVAAPALAAKLTADPSVTMVFADEDRGTACCAHVAREVLKNRDFAVAGYASLRRFGSSLVVERCAAVADYDESTLVATLVSTAVKLSTGASFPQRVDVPIAVRRGKTRPNSDPEPPALKSGDAIPIRQ